MISFTCDYNEGAHPLILQRLAETNLQQHAGYGDDVFTISARERICRIINCETANVFFTTGGTQTNALVIDAIAPHYAAVISADTGHIAVHESGAVEHHGHKVITLPSIHGKIEASQEYDLLVKN